ncbi:MAG: flavodoxin-dependent (E)-4-hydroxy-3-methylbut-2-enyl-diphosphate synthase [Candidatus Omnitrophota bacterium]|nr:flavodoxin-dependent (E)-4-hydroxy-3-methylbut-2-enyl-diphosphate synthase [Candidatus Omnitrophota bacterium]
MTKQIKVGNIRIGGGAPISIQSMTKTDTRDVRATVRQIKELEKAGCEIVRVAIKDFEAASAIKAIKRKANLPLVADIHFDYRLALRAIENGADKIRLNPGNIYKEPEIREVVIAAKKRKIPIRVGANSGSIRLKAQGSRLKAEDLVTPVLGYIKILERMDFYDIIVSLKASDVISTIEVCKLFSKKSEYPLHLGVTAAGPASTGIVKSAIGIGNLLLDGVGDTIRVSLTGDPVEEVIAAKNILQAINLRNFGPEIISCPTCGRCQVDLKSIAEQIDSRLKASPGFVRDRQGSRGKFSLQPSVFSRKVFKIAIMGCEVNGPGEAKEADIGIACGKGSGVIFKKGRILKRVKEKDIVKELLKNI